MPATIIISAVLLIAVFFAVRRVVRQVKNGECAGGCGGCSGCSHGCDCHSEKK